MKIFKKVDYYANAFLHLKADGKILSIFRILFTIIGSIFIYHTISHFDINQNDFSSSLESEIVYIAHYLWFISLLSINIGKGLVWVKIIHWLLSAILLNTNDFWFVTNYFYAVTSFWMIFIDTNSHYNIYRSDKTQKQVKAWSIYFFFISIGMSFFTSGLTKLLDPVWLNGYGIKYFFQLGWPIANIFKDIFIPDILLFSLNYLVLFFEISIIFLFLLPITRHVGLILIFLFFGLLIFPLRLDMIGPFGITICVAFLSLRKIKKTNYEY